MGNPHVLAIPYPAQGHVIPLMEVSLWLVKHGIRVTFVNTEFNHKRVVKSLQETDKVREMISMVCIPDGLEPWEDRNELGRLTEAIVKVMPEELEFLIQRMNGSEGDQVTCVLADWGMGWALEVAQKLGLRRASFWPAAAAVLGLSFSIPKLVDDGIIDCDGKPLKKEMIQLSPSTPLMNPMNFFWNCIGDEATRKIIFEVTVENNRAVKLADWLICNSSHEMEPGAFSLFPNMIPIGPLLASHRLGKQAGYFWQGDSACVEWLDQQQDSSVIYIAFGSFTVFDQTQFEELALGLELTNRPFLWVVRQDEATDNERVYPKNFKERIANRGRIITWAPQQQVLSHRSIACFISHCGWNSTAEGVSNGVPFLCWPYFADQFFNQTYIWDEWKIGLALKMDEMGIVRRGEIKDKVEHVVMDGSYKTRAEDLQDKIKSSVKRGCSYNNFRSFIDWIEKN